MSNTLPLFFCPFSSTVKEYQEYATKWSKEWRSGRYNNDKPADVPSVANAQTSESIPSTSIPSSTMSAVSLPICSSGSNNETKDTTHPTAPEEEPSTKIMTPATLEQNYWDIVEGQSQEIDVDYGNDVDTTEIGSGFPISERGRSVNSPNFLLKDSEKELTEPSFGTEQYYKETYWNLNNIPNSKNSVLRHVKVGINGINVPWLYFGSLFSTFCWHNEDNHMYSINYHHRGAPKQWYGVPGTKHDADGVERVFKNYLAMKLRDAPDLIHHITTFFSPRLLHQDGVNVCKLLQNEGEFIVTFPRAFHGGYSLGPNCGEAVNFALHDWIPHAVDANERYRTFGRPSVFSHDRLMYTIANHTSELRTKEICNAVSMELRRLMGEELLLRTKLIRSGIRDVSKEVQLPPNRLDQLDEMSADYDDKRLCHSCKHICFFSAVACECSESKVSCLRHSHYMCRCSVKRKYLLVWTTEQEMKDTISRVEKRGEEVEYANPAAAAASPQVVSKGALKDAPGADKDRANHCSFKVPVDPICTLHYAPEIPTLISSDVSCGSSGSKDGPAVKTDTQLSQQNEQIKNEQTIPNSSIDSNQDSNINVLMDNNPQTELLLMSSTNIDSQKTNPVSDITNENPDIGVVFKPSEIISSDHNTSDGNGAASDDFSA